MKREDDWNRVGRRKKGVKVGLGPAWDPIPLRSGPPAQPSPQPPQPDKPRPCLARPQGAQPLDSRPHSLVQLQIQSEVGVEGWDDEAHLGQMDRLGERREGRRGVDLGRPGSGNWGAREAWVPGAALGRGWPRPSSCGDH